MLTFEANGEAQKIRTPTNYVSNEVPSDDNHCVEITSMSCELSGTAMSTDFVVFRPETGKIRRILTSTSSRPLAKDDQSLESNCW